MFLVFFTVVWQKILPNNTGITCENFIPKSFRIRKLCDVKFVAKNTDNKD